MTLFRLDEAFDGGAARYDLLTRLNPGYRRHLAAAARAAVADMPPGGLVADLGCGSGLSTQALLDAGATRVLAVDASAGMLAQAQAKHWPAGVEFVHAPAQELPAVLADRGVDALDGVLAAYLLRNLPADGRGPFLAQLHRWVRPGATLVLHDYALAPGRRARVLWRAVCRTVVRPLARAVDGNAELYRYLEDSVLANWSPDRIAGELATAGFTRVRIRTVAGWQRGILHDVSGIA